MGLLPKPHHSFESYLLFWLWTSWQCCDRTPPAGLRVLRHISAHSLTHSLTHSFTHSLTHSLTHSPPYLQRILDTQLHNWNGVKRTEGASVNVGPPPKPCALVLISLLVWKEICIGVTLSSELGDKSNGQSLRNEYDKQVDRAHN